MFYLSQDPVEYKDPWKLSYHERFRMLLSGKYKVAYFYEKPDNSTFRYRVYNMIQALGESEKDISSSFFCNDDLNYLDKVVDVSDVLVLCRTRYTNKVNRLITRAKNKGKTVFFDVDDLVFDPSYVHLVLNTLDQDLEHPDVWDTWFAYFSRMGEAMRLCDRFITTNEFLAKHIRRYFHKPVSVIPNFLNKEQISISHSIYNEKKESGFARNDNITLGYFSGTPTHNKDFDIISEALCAIFEKYSNVSLLIVGFMEIKGRLNEYRSRIQFYPLHDFINLQRLIGLVEVNLIPLQDNLFTNCKSELKYFEAGIVGTVSVASPVYTYRKSIRDMDNSNLASEVEWFKKIESLIVSIDNYEQMADKAFHDSEEKYAWYNHINLIEKTLLLD